MVPGKEESLVANLDIEAALNFYTSRELVHAPIDAPCDYLSITVLGATKPLLVPSSTAVCFY